MRELIYIPIIHNLWSEYEENEEFIDNIRKLSDELKNQYESFKREYFENLDNHWNNIENFIQKYKINKIYQDGCYYNDNLVEDTLNIYYYKSVFRNKKEISRNFNCINNLIENGSELILTDCPWAIIHSKHSKEDISELLRYRDQFIARRVNYTLKDNDTGILFIGYNHTNKYLKQINDINLITYDNLKPLDNIVKLVKEIR